LQQAGDYTTRNFNHFCDETEPEGGIVFQLSTIQ